MQLKSQIKMQFEEEDREFGASDPEDESETWYEYQK